MFLPIVFLLLSLHVELYSSAPSIRADLIKTDTSTLTKLFRQFKELMPSTARQFVKASCQMTTECCGESLTNSTTIISLFNATEFIHECFGEIHSLEFERRLIKCKPLVNLMSLALDDELNKFFLLAMPDNTDDLQEIIQMCSKEEIHSMICDWNNYNQAEMCQLKILQNWSNQNDEKTYKKKVQQVTDEQNRLIKKLKKVKA